MKRIFPGTVSRAARACLILSFGSLGCQPSKTAETAHNEQCPAVAPAVAAEPSGSVALEDALLHGDEEISTPVGTVKLVDSYFGQETSTQLFDEMDYQRA